MKLRDNLEIYVIIKKKERNQTGKDVCDLMLLYLDTVDSGNFDTLHVISVWLKSSEIDKEKFNLVIQLI